MRPSLSTKTERRIREPRANVALRWMRCFSQAREPSVCNREWRLKKTQASASALMQPTSLLGWDLISTLRKLNAQISRSRSKRKREWMHTKSELMTKLPFERPTYRRLKTITSWCLQTWRLKQDLNAKNGSMKKKMCRLHSFLRNRETLKKLSRFSNVQNSWWTRPKTTWLTWRIRHRNHLPIKRCSCKTRNDGCHKLKKFSKLNTTSSINSVKIISETFATHIKPNRWKSAILKNILSSFDLDFLPPKIQARNSKQHF